MGIAKLLEIPIKSHNASKKLIEYGSDAENVVLNQIDSSNFVVMVELSKTGVFTFTKRKVLLFGGLRFRV